MASSARCRSTTASPPSFSGAEHVDEHDLPVEPAEMIAEERPHDVRLIALEAARHHGGERRAPVARLVAEGERTEGEQRRAFEIARQQKAAGPGRVQHMIVGTRRLEIGGKEVRSPQRHLLVLGGIWIDAGEKLAPGFRVRLPARRRRLLHRLGAPLLVAHVEQRQVDQPLAGIVDDVEIEAGDAEGTAQGAGRFELDGDAHLAKGAACSPAIRADRATGHRGAPRSRSAAPRRRAAARDRRARCGPRPRA